MSVNRAPDAQVRRYWNRDAPWYDGCMHPYDRLLVGDGRAWVGAHSSGRVLEVAVGTGRNLPHYPAGTQVIGIDLCPGMLERARPRAAASAAAVRLVEGSAAALPFPDACFDTVVCVLALCCMSDDRAAVREMHRVLRPGGRLLLLDHIPGSRFPVRAVQRLALPVLRRLSSAYHLCRPLLLAEEAGFTVTRRERYCLGMVERLVAVKEPAPA
ncbi:class I SAM-dependent methyltransferase [Streptomyces sp. NPDC006385]|uniref:class I SAM-dependent methyltransferase n=1 Tax=Streptomyces sp. NPDC006385 TaxID=3156761 RepID=UPI0033A91AF7